MSKVTSRQMIQILEMFEQGEYDREFAQAIIEKRIALCPPNAGELPAHHYLVTVTSVGGPTFAELEANYGEGNVSDLWDESRNKIWPHKSLLDPRAHLPPGSDCMFFLKKFDQRIKGEKAIKWAHDNGYRLVFPWEREAFSRAHPDLQKKFYIMDFGSRVLQDDTLYVPYLYKIGRRRYIGHDRFDETRWGAGYRFLFARK